MTDLLAECFALPMAVSTVVNQQPVISRALAAPVAELEPVVKNAPVCNIDETSWRQRGAQRRSWLWTVVSAQGTLFRIAPSRTCRQQQRPVFDFLRDALIAYRTGQPAPSLLPAH